MSDPQQQQRIGAPPRTDDRALGRWMQDVTDALNALPTFSLFSGTTPESLVTAAPATLGINLDPTSNTTKLWIKRTGYSHTGWASIASDRAY